MVSEKHYIAKGVYRHSQIDHFISVKNYIFLRNNGKKYLLLRFSNELDYAVDGLTYAVLQYDANGNEITNKRIDMDGVKIRPHEMFATDSALEVDEKCVDFRVVFLEVRSGKYHYRTVEKIVSVYYADTEDLFDDEESLYEAEPIYEYSVTRRRFGDVRRVKSLAAIIVLILLTINILHMIFAYRAYINETEENASHRETYVESTEISAMNFDDGERYAEI